VCVGELSFGRVVTRNEGRSCFIGRLYVCVPWKEDVCSVPACLCSGKVLSEGWRTKCSVDLYSAHYVPSRQWWSTYDLPRQILSREQQEHHAPGQNDSRNGGSLAS
jgi:hypothetical protein